MTRICIAGSVGIDRIWQLDQPLRPGARLRCLHRFCRLGGGAANTGAALAVLGRTVELAARVRRDPAGDRLLALLETAGLDTARIERSDGTTQAGDIFLQPDGERTLISAGGQPVSVPAALLGTACRLAYLNIARLSDPLALRPLLDRCHLVAQLPLDLAEPRPAHLLIASRSDIGGLDATELFRQRRTLDGEALAAMVVTDGGHGAALVQADGMTELHATPLDGLSDSIGAGDFFAAGLLDALARDLPAAEAITAGHVAARRFLLERPPVLGERIEAA
jgi:sugar/nucleoside kinase (ribokinase family)